MSDETVVERANYDIPYGRNIDIKDVSFESGMEILRLTIREGRRFTVVDLDKQAAERICANMSDWLDTKASD